VNFLTRTRIIGGALIIIVEPSSFPWGIAEAKLLLGTIFGKDKGWGKSSLGLQGLNFLAKNKWGVQKGSKRGFKEGLHYKVTPLLVGKILGRAEKGVENVRLGIKEGGPQLLWGAHICRGKSPVGEKYREGVITQKGGPATKWGREEKTLGEKGRTDPPQREGEHFTVYTKSGGAKR